MAGRDAAPESSSSSAGGMGSGAPRPAREPGFPFLIGDRYLAERELGRGGMGRVYLAEDRRLKRRVAIKVISRIADEREAQRLEQEARLIASLGHANILQVHDIGWFESGPFLVEECLEGQTVRQLVEKGPLPVARALDLAAQAARGLAAAHEHQVVHCDLKPENLFVTVEGQLKILDFGVARLGARGATDTLDEDAPADPALSGFAGTPAYSSPEQIRSGSIDHRSDLFSLGVVLFEMLSGARPFNGADRVQVAYAVLQSPPDPLPDRIPAALRRIVERCLEKDPGSRFQSARELEAALQEAARKGAAGRWPRRALLLAVPVALGLAAGAILGPRGRRPQAPTYQQITFHRGAVWAARFAPDGKSVVYAAATAESPLPQLYSTGIERPEPRQLEAPPANLAAVSSKGELAVLVRPQLARFGYDRGTLARFFPGSAPRELVEDVEYADWTPDGSALAVVRVVKTRAQLEFPLHRVLFSTAGWISHPRFSPDGQRIAFLHHPSPAENGGTVMVSDLEGKVRELTPAWRTVESLAWSGGELWFTAAGEAEPAGNVPLRAVDPSGAVRVLAQVTGALKLQDVAADGRAAVTHPQLRLGLALARPGEPRPRDLSWLDTCYLGDLSADGKQVVFWVEGPAAGSTPVLYVRGTDGTSPPVRLGEGFGVALSGDGKWVAALSPRVRDLEPLTLFPAGPGEPRTLDAAGVTAVRARWFPDGKRLLVAGTRPNGPLRLYVRDLDGGAQRPISPEGVGSGWLSISTDGSLVVALDAARRVTLYPVAGGAPIPLPEIGEDERPFGFAADGSLFVGRPPDTTLPVYRFDVRTRRRTLHTTLTASAPGAQGIFNVVAATDGSAFAFNYGGLTSDLFLLRDAR